MKKIAIPIIILALIVMIGYWIVSALRKESNHRVIEISGSIETTEADGSFQIPGKIKHFYVEEGDMVRKGQLLAALDDEDLRKQRDSARAALDAAESQLPLLEARIVQSRESARGRIEQAKAGLLESQYRYQQLQRGLRRQEIQVARKELDAAGSSLSFLKKEYLRAMRLHKEGAMPGQQRDSAKMNFEVALARYRQAKERLSLSLEGSREEEVKAGWARVRQAEAGVAIASTANLDTEVLLRQERTLRAQVSQARASLTYAETQLKHTRLEAPMAGVVLVKPKETGEVVTPGTPVVTLGEIRKLWLRAYIPETDLGRVKLGQKVEVVTDTFPGRKYEGKIFYISSQAEFTPKTLQTKE
ncbi:MAG: efflux RND transporter periplasmic adaptor subunit, partial [Armatimonadetes bacterium]|nr:efflux RND transporter periplasmic adaptor subunit [Armatimonadota bacterium]